jgi:hypothetical protein
MAAADSEANKTKTVGDCPPRATAPQWLRQLGGIRRDPPQLLGQYRRIDWLGHVMLC